MMSVSKFFTLRFDEMSKRTKMVWYFSVFVVFYSLGVLTGKAIRLTMGWEVGWLLPVLSILNLVIYSQIMRSIRRKYGFPAR